MRTWIPFTHKPKRRENVAVRDALTALLPPAHPATPATTPERLTLTEVLHVEREP